MDRSLADDDYINLYKFNQERVVVPQHHPTIDQPLVNNKIEPINPK